MLKATALIMRFHIGCVVLLLIGAVHATASEPANKSKQIHVTSGIPPLATIVEAIGGNRVAVTPFMQESQDPHTFSPSPRQISGLKNCDLFLVIGMPFEEVVASKISKMYPELPIVNLATAFKVNHGEGHHGHEHGDHDHENCHAGGVHLWLSARNLQVIAKETAEALILLDPSGKSFYETNCRDLVKKLQDLDVEIGKKLAHKKGATFYAYHPAYEAFAEDYGLTQKAVEHEGKSPTPRQLLALVEQARKDGVSTILVEPQFPSRPAQIIAQRIGGKVVAVNPLGKDPMAVLKQLADAVADD